MVCLSQLRDLSSSSQHTPFTVHKDNTCELDTCVKTCDTGDVCCYLGNDSMHQYKYIVYSLYNVTYSSKEITGL